MQSPGMWRIKLRLRASPSRTAMAIQVLGNPSLRIHLRLHISRSWRGNQ